MLQIPISFTIELPVVSCSISAAVWFVSVLLTIPAWWLTHWHVAGSPHASKCQPSTPLVSGARQSTRVLLRVVQPMRSPCMAAVSGSSDDSVRPALQYCPETDCFAPCMSVTPHQSTYVDDGNGLVLCLPVMMGMCHEPRITVLISISASGSRARTGQVTSQSQGGRVACVVKEKGRRLRKATDEIRD